jgi:hypothetical protein
MNVDCQRLLLELEKDTEKGWVALKRWAKRKCIPPLVRVCKSELKRLERERREQEYHDWLSRLLSVFATVEIEGIEGWWYWGGISYAQVTKHIHLIPNGYFEIHLRTSLCRLQCERGNFLPDLIQRSRDSGGGICEDCMEKIEESGGDTTALRNYHLLMEENPRDRALR